uniref:Uncharacterized protein n=1 Tax=Lepeophtheirus salmonis TaxID=72036 RepID=A0A0K2TRM5_LEPSM
MFTLRSETFQRTLVIIKSVGLKVELGLTSKSFLYLSLIIFFFPVLPCHS